jgi:hypothetical protein
MSTEPIIDILKRIAGINGKQARNVSELTYEDIRNIILDNERLESKAKLLEAALAASTQNFKDLVRACKWYADNGMEQERYHFLMWEAQGNYLDLAELEIEAILNPKPQTEGEI